MNRLTILFKKIDKIIILLVALLILLWLAPKENRFKYEYTKGKPWKYEDYYAIEDIGILKPELELNKEKEKVIAESHIYFKYNNEIVENVKKKFEEKLNKTSYYSPNSEQSRIYKRLYANGIAIIDSIYQYGIVQPNSVFADKDENLKVALIKDNIATILPLSKIYSVNSANVNIIKMLAKIDNTEAQFILPILQDILEYNVYYNKTTTQRVLNQELKKISPTLGMIQRGEKVITKGEIVSEQKFQTLESIKLEYESQAIGKLSFYRIISGQLILLLSVLITFILFLKTFEPYIYSNNRNIVLLLSIILLFVITAVVIYDVSPQYINLTPICIVPVITRLFFDSRTAFFTHVTTVILISFLVISSFDYVFTQLIVGSVALIMVVGLERRSQLLTASVVIFISYAVIHTGFVLADGALFSDAENYRQYYIYALSAFFTMMSFPLILVFERIFGKITSISLIELSDTNTPLLRELSIKAPGTFQHSMVVANISEEASRAVGANPLLARAGAFYHDIGKIVNPNYFIENQTLNFNPHDELSSEESAEIITGHIIHGIEKARAYKLPNELIDFIRTHHGTRKTTYFYNKFKNLNPDKTPDEKAFSYRGPIPFTKETTIVMIADSIEAAARAMKSPDEQSLSNMVDNIVHELLISNQLDNTTLSIKEIEEVKNVIKRRLMSVHHARIEYPK